MKNRKDVVKFLKDVVKFLKDVVKFLKDNFTFYICFIIFTGLNILILLSFHDLFQGSANSTRYFFSTIAQSQAAIVAIVITLTLVAVQLASQTYTPRIMDFYLKSKMFWSLLALYSISIIYDVAVLAAIPPSINDILTNPVVVSGVEITFSALVLVGLILLMSTSSYLFFFIRDVIKQLKPEEMVKRLIRDVNLNELKIVAEGDLVDDPLLPIKEMSRVALASGDELTASKIIVEINRIAVKVIGDIDFAKRKTPKERSEEIIQFRSYEEEYDEIYLNKHIVDYFTTFFSDLAYSSLECNSTTSFKNIVTSFADIGVLLANKKSYLAIYILYYLEDMEKSYRDKGFENDTDVLFEFGVVSIASAENRLWDVVEYANGIMGLLISEYNEKDLKDSNQDIIYGGDLSKSLRPILIINHIRTMGGTMVEEIPNIGGREALDGIEDCFEGLIEIDIAISHLSTMAKIAIKKRWKRIMGQSVDAIIEISGALINKGGENLRYPINPTDLLSKSLEQIATSSTDDNVYYKTKQIVQVLKEWCEYLANKRSINVSVPVDSLIETYRFVYMNHCKVDPCDMILGAPDSLGDIGKLTMDSFSVTQKITDAIEEIGINASKNNHPESSWSYVAKSAAKQIIFFATQYIKNENEEISELLIQNLKNMDCIYQNKGPNSIREIIIECKDGMTFGQTEKIETNGGSLKHHEIKMDDSDFNAYLRFIELYNES